MAVGTLGPFDKRLKRSRCLNCAARRVKCSKELPCTSCRQRFLDCRYPATATPVITIDNQPKASLSLSVLSKPDDEARSFQHFFHVFLPQNRFSGGSGDWHHYLTTQVPQCRGHFSALVGIGAMTVYTSGSKDQGLRDPHMLELAIQSYQRSVNYLGSRTRSCRGSWNHQSMLSLAFLLSLFELMYDPTGVVWNAHMGFGASVLLKAFGPGSFSRGCPLSIYREIRLFEISRSALFTQPTLLSQGAWVLHDEGCRARDWGLLETVFDLFLQSSILSQSANMYVDSQNTDPIALFELVEETQKLRAQLMVFSNLLCESTRDSDASMAWIYYHAISIYLSGIFDYTLAEVCAGASLSLQDDEIATHREGIITWCDEALRHTQVSRVFLLLPLRIAGNRCKNSKQCQEVLHRLDVLRDQFAVATAFRTELLQLWFSRSLYV